MFLQLSHTKLDVYQASRLLCLQCYRITTLFPSQEKFTMVQQIRRAALSVHLNLAEGCSRKSKVERSRYYEVSRGSVIEIDTCFDIAAELGFVNIGELQPLGDSIIKVFKLLSGMINPGKA